LPFEQSTTHWRSLRCIAALPWQWPIKAPSLGGCETLITQPAQTSHAGLSPSERQSIGITDGVLRLSVGLEAAEDLIADFTQALE